MTHAEAKPSLYRNVRIHQSARLSPAAGIVGDVTIGRDASVFAGVVPRFAPTTRPSSSATR